MKKTQKFPDLRAFQAMAPMFFLAVPIGITYGFMYSQYYDAWLAPFTSIIVFAGASQFFGLELAKSNASYTEFALAAFFINIRHIFYGLSVINRYKVMKWYQKIPAIFLLTDEVWGILTTTAPKADKKQDIRYILSVGLIFYFYWVLGTTIGAYSGQFFKGINTQGLEFVGIGLFIVLAVEQIRARPKAFSPCLGLLSALISALIFGAQNLILPAMIIIFLGLTLRAIYMENRQI
ncbi:MAG: AzlC family ABC transporter permease [Alphaproteobacteria bacterium]